MYIFLGERQTKNMTCMFFRHSLLQNAEILCLRGHLKSAVASEWMQRNACMIWNEYRDQTPWSIARNFLELRSYSPDPDKNLNQQQPVLPPHIVFNTSFSGHYIFRATKQHTEISYKLFIK
jgi:hypothetical protein